MRTQAELNSEIQRLHGQTATAAAGARPGGSARDGCGHDGGRLEVGAARPVAAVGRRCPAPVAPPLTTGFLEDLLTDSDGISFHRFQIVMWTLMLGFVFSVSVWRELKMPAFDTSLLRAHGHQQWHIPRIQVPGKAGLSPTRMILRIS